MLGGFKWSSQRLRVGGCDEQAEAALRSSWTGAIALAGPASGRGARRTGIGDCSGLIDLWLPPMSIGARWFQSCHQLRAIGQATIGPVSAKRSVGARLLYAGGGAPDRAAASTISRELRRNAATRGGGLIARHRTVARGAIGSSAKTGEACAQSGLAHLCARAPGRNGRRSKRGSSSWSDRVIVMDRGRRRWARASPEQIARRPVDFPDDMTMRIMRLFTKPCSFKGVGLCVANWLPVAHRAGATCAAGTHTRSRQELRLEIMQPTPGRSLTARCRTLGRRLIAPRSVGTYTRFTIAAHDRSRREARIKNGPALAGHGAEAVCEAIARTITTLPEQLRRADIDAAGKPGASRK